MREIEWTTAFKRDFKRCDSFESPFIEALWKLANDEILPERFCDHPLSGEWKDFRDCHIKPDLVLISSLQALMHNGLRKQALSDHYLRPAS